MDVVSKILKKSIKEAEKSITVDKHLDLEYDLGTLLAVDNNKLDMKSLSNRTNEYLLNLSRDNVQLLLNKIWELPTEQLNESVVAKLPPSKFFLPRAKSAPKPKPPTKWEQFAKLKGIMKKKKPKLSWDQQLKKWVPLYGYQKTLAEKERDWVLEVPATSDPMEDQFSKRKTGKAEKVAKNELQRLRNIAKAKNIKIPRLGLTHPDVSSSKDLQTAITVTRTATSSLGKFQDKLSKEKEARGISELMPGSNRKRKLPSVTKEVEHAHNLEIINAVLSKRPKINVNKAVSRQINYKQEQSEEQPTSKFNKHGRRKKKTNSKHNGKKTNKVQKRNNKRGGIRKF
ncbi:hypothetical protein FQA39_LY18075 [Lamprigera yunnana]|nr:hypothetical protein FQA39_LY18075 [Lamprigera yunnana]